MTDLATSDSTACDRRSRRALTKPARATSGLDRFLAIPAVLAARGVDRGKGVRPSRRRSPAVSGPRQPSSARIRGSAAGNLRDLTGCDHFGLLVGERFDLRGLGPIGELMRHSATVGDALRILVRHLHLHDRGRRPCCSPPTPQRPSSAIPSFVMACRGPTISTMRRSPSPTRFCARSAAPPSRRSRLNSPMAFREAPRITEMFGCDVVFDADLSGVVIDAASLARPHRRRRCETPRAARNGNP